jgi:hypothetical protein
MKLSQEGADIFPPRSMGLVSGIKHDRFNFMARAELNSGQVKCAKSKLRAAAANLLGFTWRMYYIRKCSLHSNWRNVMGSFATGHTENITQSADGGHKKVSASGRSIARLLSPQLAEVSNRT